MEAGVGQAEGAVAEEVSDGVQAVPGLPEYLLGGLSVENDDDEARDLVGHGDLDVLVLAVRILLLGLDKLLLILFEQAQVVGYFEGKYHVLNGKVVSFGP